MRRHIPIRYSLLVLSLALGACAVVPPSSDGLRYVPPAARGAMPPVDLPGATTAESLAIVAARLRAAGFQGVSIDSRRGRVTARSSDPALVDCGTFIQTARGNTARFPANALRAVLFSADVPGGIVTREVRVSSDVTVALNGAGSARVATAHEVRSSQSFVGQTSGSRDATRFGGDATGTMADGVVCTGSRVVADVLKRG
jgi:hypothetical protein